MSERVNEPASADLHAEEEIQTGVGHVREGVKADLRGALHRAEEGEIKAVAELDDALRRTEEVLHRAETAEASLRASFFANEQLRKENRTMLDNLTAVQARCTELVEELRRVKAEKVLKEVCPLCHGMGDDLGNSIEEARMNLKEYPSVECPACLAASGKSCRDVEGRLTVPHDARKKMYEATKEAEKEWTRIGELNTKGRPPTSGCACKEWPCPCACHGTVEVNQCVHSPATENEAEEYLSVECRFCLADSGKSCRDVEGNLKGPHDARKKAYEAKKEEDEKRLKCCPAGTCSLRKDHRGPHGQFDSPLSNGYDIHGRRTEEHWKGRIK